MTKTTRHTIYLFVTALIWGTAFVAQSAGNVMGALTFNCLRNFLGFLVLIPAILFFCGNLRVDRPTLIGGLSCGLCLFFASNLQQVGMLYTSPGKAGFVTASYMLLVPVAGIFLGRKMSGRILAAVLLGAFGLYLLCIPQGEGLSGINFGDVLCIVCAGVFTAHILCVDHFAPKAEGIKMSCIQFLVVGVLTLVPALLFETVSQGALLSGLIPLLYAGVLSSGVGYSLQIIGQDGVNPAVAALIMSLESCFAVLAGWILLGDVLNGRELFGCLLMFAAIVLTQLPERRKETA